MDLICLFGRCLYYVRLNNKVLFFKSKYYRIMHVIFVFFHQLGPFAVNYDSTYTYPDHAPLPPPHWYSTTIVAAEPRKTFAWSPLICIFDFTMLNTISSYQHILGTKTFTAECLCVYLQILRVSTKWNAFLGRNVHRHIGHRARIEKPFKMQLLLLLLSIFSLLEFRFTLNLFDRQWKTISPPVRMWVL